MPLTEQQQSLVREIIDWLPDAGLGDIAAYRSGLERRLPGILTIIEPEVPGEAYAALKRALEGKFDTNAPSVATPNDIISLLVSLTTYSPRSVLASFTAEYPEARFATVPAEATAWASRMIGLWNNALYFTCYGRYEAGRPYLLSSLRTLTDAAAVAESAALADTALDELGTLLLTGNFQEVPWNKESALALRALIESLPFFPDDYAPQLLSRPADAGTYAFLKILSEILGFLAAYLQDGAPKPTEDELTALFLERCRHDTEMAYLQSVTAKLGLRQLDYPGTELYLSFLNLLTADAISDGSCLVGIRKLLDGDPALTEPKRLVMRQALEDSPMVQTLLEPYECAFIMEAFSQLPERADRLDYVATLKEGIPSEMRTAAQTLLLMLVELL